MSEYSNRVALIQESLRRLEADKIEADVAYLYQKVRFINASYCSKENSIPRTSL